MTTPDASHPHETRQRILDAAAEVFAEHGFQASTVRDICHRAEANVAAVNYHFGDKEALYNEVFRYTSRITLETYPPFAAELATAPPELRLRHFVRAFLQKVMAEDRTALHGKLMAHEMIRPTAILDAVFEEAIRPQAERLAALVQEIAEGVPPATAKRCCLSIVGQILFYKHCRPIVTRVDSHFGTPADDLETLTDHITEFSVVGLQHLARKRKNP